MKYQETHTVSCCDFSFTADNKHDAMVGLIKHIRRKHPDVVKRINKKGRENAMGQNGCGYYDCGKGNSGGWFEAQPSFRESHKLNALARMLGTWLH